MIRNTQPKEETPMTDDAKAKFERLQRAKDQHKALKAWEAAGGDLAEPRTPRPETPDLDAINAEHEAEAQAAAEARARADQEQAALAAEHKAKKGPKAREPKKENTDMPKPTTTKPERASSGSRRKPGSIGDEIVAFLQRRARAAEGFSPTAIGAEIGASSGATANALDKLEAAGRVRKVSAKPKRYAIVAKSERKAS